MSVDTLVRILKHRGEVSRLLKHLASELQTRADIHDISKLTPDEFSGFAELDELNKKKSEYGSAAYEAAIKNNQAVALHLKRNRHHPEYWPNGVSDMSLVDIIEMLFDWEIARRERDTEADIEKTWQVRQQRFGLSNDEMKFLREVWDRFGDEAIRSE